MAPSRTLEQERDLLFVGSLQENGHSYLSPGPVAFCDKSRCSYFTMRLLNAPRTVLDECEGRSLIEILDLLEQVLDAVSAVHDQRILHRDLKPENILIVDGERPGMVRVVVVDFGIAKRHDSPRPEQDHSLTTLFGAENFNGTPEYAAPELLRDGFGVADIRTEVVAMGVLAHEMLAGRRLYPPAADHSRNGRINEALRFWAGEFHPRASDLLEAAWPSSQISVMRSKRDTHYRALVDLLRFPLNQILLCATHEERGRRYESLRHFRQDLSAAVRAMRGSNASDAFYWQRKLASGDPYVRSSYRERIATDAALIHGANALIDRADIRRADRLLSLVSAKGRPTIEYHFTFNRAHPYLVELQRRRP